MWFAHQEKTESLQQMTFKKKDLKSCRATTFWLVCLTTLPKKIIKTSFTSISNMVMHVMVNRELIHYNRLENQV